MLNSLEVLNYRNLKSLRINSLERVNLITGKNNTGKSTLLEAISIYASRAELLWMLSLLEERGENYRNNESRNIKENLLEANIRTLSSLFSDRRNDFSPENAIVIGTIEPNLFNTNGDLESAISLRLVKYVDEVTSEGERLFRRRKILVDESENNKVVDYKVGFEINTGKSSYIVELDEEKLYRLGIRTANSQQNFQYIRTRNIELESNGKLWDKIALSEKEFYVIEALKIIEPSVERVAFVSSPNSERNRTAVVKLRGVDQVLPLRSMGDGINRILTIILALVNSDKGYLLIDEFENGLHYSVQEKLWEIVFELANRLNIQVFATTHSNDCIYAFESIINNKAYKDGKLIRLDNINGAIRSVEFTANDLRIAAQQNIDTR